MTSFIKSVLLDLKSKQLNLEDLHFILPSKRAGVFLKKELGSLISTPIFAPQIISIEDFVEDLSGLRNLSQTELLFKLYKAYIASNKESEIEPFDAFSKWAQIILQDFNEIDRYLVPQAQVFEYIVAFYKLNNWSLDAGASDMINNYFKFWNKLNIYYSLFTEDLIESKEGYQGLIYREATENIEVYIENNQSKIHVFLGFNALNTSESLIIQALLQNELAHIYWDIDKVFLDDPVHDAGLFLRKYLKEWNYFKSSPFYWASNQYRENKTIEVIGIPKLIGQAKHIGQLLKKIKTTNETLSNVAVVLGEENLLLPVLNSIPREISTLNVTMGLPLKHIPLTAVFEYLFLIHKNNSNEYYYKDVIDVLSHPAIITLLTEDNKNISQLVINHIQSNNIVYITTKDLGKLIPSALLTLLFDSWQNDPEIALENCTQLIFKMKSNYDKDKSKNKLELEYLYRFNTLFNQLSKLNNTYGYINSVNTLHTIFKELLNSESLDFKGEPLDGLQIMGMLESRVLDFETVIISSVNEGILPSGKTTNSFIPFNIKVENGIPTYLEKDAVYTYHFYRLLQRAKNIYILYNTEVDALKGGEKSRFITQLEVESNHNIEHKIITPAVPVTLNESEQIVKSKDVLKRLKEIAGKGFSPSSLTNYMRNPIDFYYEKILGINAFDDVEEAIAANTLGSVIHNSLEDFYKPLEDEFLTLNHLSSFKRNIEPTVTKHFKSLYRQGNFNQGKNLIIFEIAKRYISNFIDSEIAQLKAGDQIRIISIEAENCIDIEIPEINFPVKLTGKVDRVDQLNGVTRVIDYKSGKVEKSKVEIVNWEDLTTDYDKYSKSFQVLSYAYMMHRQKQIELPIEAGIISFKNLKGGFLKFGIKESTHSRKKIQLITEETMGNFEVELKKLILEICSPSLNFIEKVIK
ncbi:MAG: PD-(D/E)XK nuclease family protein [Winogradskyella sp.]|uniref:PD-(D/E)XK nuclease family protein n=1 Tax=Winogradskyella sp. TaxID=1883156 RepID=UPI00184CFBFB|nr:PD-(D/E)XK nuclease family protein [Winogradskyella sp.]